MNIDGNVFIYSFIIIHLCVFGKWLVSSLDDDDDNDDEDDDDDE